jgi:hypothetical protein
VCVCVCLYTRNKKYQIKLHNNNNNNMHIMLIRISIKTNHSLVHFIFVVVISFFSLSAINSRAKCVEVLSLLWAICAMIQNRNERILNRLKAARYKVNANIKKKRKTTNKSKIIYFNWLLMGLFQDTIFTWISVEIDAWTRKRKSWTGSARWNY